MRCEVIKVKERRRDAMHQKFLKHCSITHYYLSRTVKTSMKEEWNTFYVSFDLCHVWPYHIFPTVLQNLRVQLFINLSWNQLMSVWCYYSVKAWKHRNLYYLYDAHFSGQWIFCLYYNYHWLCPHQLHRSYLIKLHVTSSCIQREIHHRILFCINILPIFSG